jgi:hypothetical protein
MKILKATGIDWGERRFISKLYMDQSVKARLKQEEKKYEDWKRSYKSMLLFCRFYSNYTANTLSRKLLRVVETSKYEDK